VAVWRGVTGVHARLAGALDDALQRGLGLSLTDTEALEAIGGGPDGRARISALGPPLGLTPSGASRCVDRLERAGLVVREACPEDGRGWFAAITDTGRGRLRAALALRRSALTGPVGEILSDDEAACAARWAVPPRGPGDVPDPGYG